MKRQVLFPILFLLLTGPNAASAQDISGFWQGVFYQKNNLGPSNYYPGSMELKQVGNVVTGVETSQVPNAPAYIKINLTGTIVRDTFRYAVSGVIAEVSPTGNYVWCKYSTGVLVYDALAETLMGVTNSPGCAELGSAEFWRLKVLSDTVFCEGSPVNLQVSGQAVRWYSNFPVSNQINQGNNYSPSITNSTTYYLTQTLYNTQSPAIAVNVTIKKRTFGTISQTICEGQTFLGHSRSGQYVDTLVSSLGCDSIRSINLTVTSKPVIQVSKTICAGDSWLGHTAQGKYLDTIISGTGCDTVISLDLKVINKVPVNLGADLSICTGDTFTVHVGNYNSYLWDDGSVQSFRVLKKAGTYSVSATNECGVFTDVITLTERPCVIDFPNAFTPNGDGANDAFRIINATMLNQYKLIVYSRWGQKMFETSNPASGWDGRFNGRDQPQGQYVWHCEFNRLGTAKKFRGIVHLIR